MGTYYLGIDIGTFESRGLLLDKKFQVVADVSAVHGMENPKPGWFEHDAEAVWWGDFCRISQELLRKSGIRPEEIACIGASTLGTDCLPVDADLKPLRPAILYGIDARASEEAAWLTQYYGEQRVHDLFGHPICSGDTATKILWLRRQEPVIYEKARWFLTGSSYVTAKLTGEVVNDTEALLYCEPDRLAAARFSTEVVGRVTAQAAAETGLFEGTPVVAGTGDSTSEAISVGLVESGTVFFQFGSSMFFYYCTDRMLGDYHSLAGNGSLKGGKAFTVPGTYCLGDGTNAAGTLTRWVRDAFYTEEFRAEQKGGENAYSIMAREAAEVETGCGGLMMLPYIYGERSPLQDPQATGMLFGLKGEHTRKHINRAALEAVGYSVLQHMILFEEMGVPADTVITAGGGTKNRTWMQIISNMTGKPIHIPEPFQCSAYGDALLAAIGVGGLRGFAELKEILPAGTVIYPDMQAYKYYQEHYPLFRSLYVQNRELMHRYL